MADGRGEAIEAILPLVYDQLRALADRYVGPAQVEPTSLVHEAWVRLAGSDLAVRDEEHFCALAALAMRQILVDRARRRAAGKRGGGWEQVTLSGLASDGREVHDVIAVDAALRDLAELDPRQARIVELRIFGGLTAPQIARELEVSVSTVEKDWRSARAWLVVRLGDPG